VEEAHFLSGAFVERKAYFIALPRALPSQQTLDRFIARVESNDHIVFLRLTK